MTRTNVTTQFIVVFLISVSNIAYAEDCTSWVAKAISVQGNVERRSNTDQATSQWQPIKRDDELCAGEMVRVKQNSRAALILKNDIILRLNQNTTITLSSLSEDQSHWINLQQGIAHFIARIKQSFKVITPFVNAAVEGTEFVVSVNDTQTEVTVFEGKVSIKNDLGEVKITKGQTAIAVDKSIPTLAVKIKPRDAVQWSLYYPAIINFDSSLYQDFDPDNKIIIERSITAARDGQFTTALQQINLIPQDDINSSLLTYRAALYLSVGRIEKAKHDIQQVIQKQPDNAQAIALQAIFAIVQNDKTKALALAEQAATLEPNSASTALALSYVHQSLFDIDNALQIIKTVTTKNKDNALLWSRLSELYLMVGNLDEALKAAKTANDLNPNIARTHSALGFAYLTRIEVKKAEQAFNDAIERDDTDPLSRLGLGLAIIRQGNLEEGRREIEFAVTLDPNNALIRSYLGKAYYEEKRDKLAETQFEMAKQLDPNDPTAYYYNAIRLQSINRPVEALKNLEQAIKLNNNRAVFRSSLQLDQDEAARDTSLARIYNDISFGQLAFQEGWKSINIDPTNSSAHRMLADNYSNLPRHEIARVSELLQSQLLQPLNLNPIQPQLAVSHLGILDGVGPSEPAFSEFNSMFTQNNIGFLFNVIGGNQGTKGADLVISGLYDKLSYSFGKFNYKTDGFRPNNDLEHDIYNVFIQFKVSNNLSLQAEIRDEETKRGDLLLAFDPEIYSANKRGDIDAKSIRIGFNYKPGLNHTILGSFINNDKFEVETDNFVKSEPPFLVESDILTTNDERAKSLEVQYIYNLEKYKLLTGISDINLNNYQVYTL
ncbi:MAG: FecR domain-containing protein, partial [Thiohalomonadales bacterium]